MLQGEIPQSKYLITNAVVTCVRVGTRVTISEKICDC